MRVNYVKKARASKYARVCTHCSHEVQAGESYKYIEPRYGGRKIYCSNHTPRRSELTSSKMGAVYDAQDDFTPDGINSVVDAEGLLESVAEVVREVAEEYRDSIDAMPEGLQEGHVAQEMEDKIEMLESYADELEEFFFDDYDPEEGEYEDEDDYLEALRQAAQEVVDGSDF